MTYCVAQETDQYSVKANIGKESFFKKVDICITDTLC